MPSITPRIYADLVIEDSAGASQTYTVHEGDIINDLVYETNGVQNKLTGAVRVINCAANRITITQTCPPESYFDRIVQISSFVIDSSSVFDAELTQVNISDIVSIGSVVPMETTITAGSSITDAVDNAVAGQTILLPAGEYTEAVTINKQITIVGQGAVNITAPITISAGEDDIVTIEGVKVNVASTAAKTAAVDLVSGNLNMSNCQITTTSAGEEACCIRRDSTEAGTATTINLENCTIEMNVGTEGSAYSYPIAIGRFDTSAATGKYDMGNCDLILSGCTITGDVVDGQTYAIYSAARGSVNIDINDSTLSAWAAVYMNRSGQTETNGTYQDSFMGSSINITNSNLNGTQPFKAAASGSESNQFGVVVVQNSQAVDVAIENCYVTAKNNHALGDDITFAPMHAIELTGTQKCNLTLEHSQVTIETPVVEKAIVVADDTETVINDNIFRAIDKDGNEIETECVLF